MRQESPEVYYPDTSIVEVNRAVIGELKDIALRNPRKRSRLCTHQNPDDSLHEMLIVHARECYVRPHRHKNKVESFHMIEGDLDVVFFEESGEIKKIIHMGTVDKGKTFYYRLPDYLYHMVLIRSDIAVFHEITQGPFRREDTDFAVWSPGADAADGEISAFVESVELKLRSLN